MATHFICHSTEPLPHQFSPIKAPSRDHGAVSEYEVLNIPAKPHTQFPPPDWNFSQSSEEDSLPLCQPPAPTWKSPALPSLKPDPQLCLTPERGFKQVSQNQKSSLKQDIERVNKTKTRHRVRFDVDNGENLPGLDDDSDNSDEILTVFPEGRMGGGSVAMGKTYKPNLYCEDEQDVEEIPHEKCSGPSNRSVQYTVASVGNRTVYVPLGDNDTSDSALAYTDNSEFKTSTDLKAGKARTKTIRYTVGSDNQIPSVQSSSGSSQRSSVQQNVEQNVQTRPDSKPHIALKDNPKRKVAVIRETQERPVINDYHFPFLGTDPDSQLEYEHVFARPEYNSTLKLSTEIQNLKDSSVDVARALKKKLTVSETKTVEINEKAASRVNTEATYSGLVSLEVPVDDLRAQLEETKNLRVRTKGIKERPLGDTSKKEPDVMDFFSPELQKEVADFSLLGLSPPVEHLCTAIQSSALDLYRHNQVWERSDS